MLDIKTYYVGHKDMFIGHKDIKDTKFLHAAISNCRGVPPCAPACIHYGKFYIPGRKK
jgi:hypothetical protein